jgi:hypothetical protein
VKECKSKKSKGNRKKKNQSAQNAPMMQNAKWMVLPGERVETK